MTYDCIIVGGGIAGLQAAIMLGRFQRKVMIIDGGEGRSSLCKQYNNILGFPEGVSGEELRTRGFAQARNFGAERLQTDVDYVHSGFNVGTKDGNTYNAKTILFATGIEERFPDIPGIKPCLGKSVYVCPDCDGYEIIGRKTVVVGNGDAGAGLAIALKYWNEEITFINHGAEPLSLEMQGKLRENRIFVQQVNVKELVHTDGFMEKIETEGGLLIDAEKVFLGFSGNRVRSELAVNIGAETNEKGHLLVHPRTRMTNVEGVWAAGDVVDHSQLVTTAMGDGSHAGVWIHKWLHG
ncbi:Thioredoxin reductase [Halobacillus dabanensis]|uniref:Thioredoxin reductase n=1 Tax=Halobacillus dabanensis TaxID=240302 RepID=A0A1I3PYB0_HALDA|nr:NAD(P)/FAD-dependent oxidoreductase [Halobacillus dabanensis]SFJ26613.1 Thioredoxin reductase [Halobacillus dabanensis]